MRTTSDMPGIPLGTRMHDSLREFERWEAGHNHFSWEDYRDRSAPTNIQMHEYCQRRRELADVERWCADFEAMLDTILTTEGN